MPEATPSPSARPQRPGWTVLRAEPLPAPTVWPAALALAATLLAWGFVSSLLITGVGLLLFGISVVGWIKEIRHERQQH